MKTKTCTKCKQERYISDFYDRYDGSGKKTSHCKSCTTARQSKYERENRDKIRIRLKKHPERIKWYGVKWIYGLTKETWEAILVEQRGLCAICESNPATHVDHDHNCCPQVGKKTCGKCVRGLLCNSCNKALGLFKDNEFVLDRAAAYLREHKKRTTKCLTVTQGSN